MRLITPHKSAVRSTLLLPKPSSEGGTIDLIDQGSNCMGPCSSLHLSPIWGMRLHHPFSDDQCRRNQTMKGISHVVIGSVVGSLMGAAAFFAVDGLIPSAADAQVYGVSEMLTFSSDSESQLRR